MKYFNIKSIIMGIGIGIIFTSATGMVYSNSIDVKKPMTKEEIVSKAKEYGMVEKSSILKQPETTPTPLATPKSETPSPKPAVTPTPAPSSTPAPTLGPEVVIAVNDGDNAVIVTKRLYESKLISDQDSFIKKMIDSQAAYKMFAKQHHFRIGMSEEDIINELISR